MMAAPGLAAPDLSEHGQVRISAPTSFKGTNDPEEFQDFKFRLKMYLGVTRPNLVRYMTEIENNLESPVGNWDTLDEAVQAEARMLLAVLGTCCTESAGSFVRTSWRLKVIKMVSGCGRNFARGTRFEEA